MRISDWSSDVCSSDLSDRRADRRDAGFQRHDPARIDLGEYLSAARPCPPRRARGVRARCGDRRTLDRKSGVEGKSVSVRVDLGGRRSLNKKNQIIQHANVTITNKSDQHENKRK